MTRFKELRRIEAAIAHKNERELRWALGYCAMRLRIASHKHHEKHWNRIDRRVRAALLDIRSDSDRRAAMAVGFPHAWLTNALAEHKAQEFARNFANTSSIPGILGPLAPKGR